MVSICGKRYESYDEAAQDQLGVSKNSLYRFMKRENLPQMSIVEILEYCINNGISKDQILPKRKRHFTKSFEQAMIEKYGVDNYKKMFIPEENDVNANEIGHQSHTYVNVHCLCKTPHFIKNIEAFKVFRIKEGWCPYKSHTAGNKYILYEDSLGNLYPEIYTIWSDRNQHRPEEMYPTAKGEYWFKCENGFHEDYIRSLSTQISILKKRCVNICPECSNLFGFKYENLVGRQFGELIVLELDKEGTFLHSKSSHVKSTRTAKVWKCLCSCGKIVSKDANSLKYGGVKNCGNRAIHYGGDNNPNWRGGITTEHETIRKSKEYEKWRLSVYRKDHFTCQACGKQKRGDNIELHAHHIISFSSLLQCDKARLFDVNNGITLCSDCHFSSNPFSLHNIYGTDDVSPEELEDFINSVHSKSGIQTHFSVVEYMNGQVVSPLRRTNPKRRRENPNSISSKCKYWGISRSTYTARIKRGWSEEDALGIPIKESKKGCVDHEGASYPSIAEMCRKWNITRDAFDNRIKSGWGLKEALETPIKHEDTSIYDFTGKKFNSKKSMCEYYGVKPATYRQRVEILGWSQEQALTGKRERTKNVVDHNGDSFFSEREMCEAHGVSYSTFLKRKAKGLSIREALGG